MKRSLLVLLFCWGIFASCSTITAPPPADQPVGDYSGYFWAPSDSSYVYSAPDGEHHVLVSASGSVTDKNVTSGASHSFTYASANGGYSLAGIEQSLLLAMNGGERLVKDSIGHQNSAMTIRQIFTLKEGPKDTLFAADDKNIFAYTTIAGKDTFVMARSVPFTNASYLSVNGIVYAYSLGTSQLWYSDNHGYRWSNLTSNIPGGASITAIIPGNNRDELQVGLSGNGYSLYTFDGQSFQWSLDRTAPAAITAIWPGDGGGDHGIIGLADGTVSISHGGMNHQFTVAGIPIGFWQVPFSPNLYVATTKGVIAHDGSGPDIQVYGRAVSSFKGDPSQLLSSVMYLGTSDGRIAILREAGAPSEITIGAKPVTGLVGTSTHAFALSDGVAYETDFKTTRPLTPTVSSTKTFDPGTFQLFASGADSITAGYVLQTNSQVTPYTARFLEHGSRIVLDSVTFSDIVVMQYAVMNGGVIDNRTLPSYQMIFASGLGPIRIEKTYIPSGSSIPRTDTTRFLRKAR